MPEAWELVTDSERTSDSLTTFILFCEDKVNEPYYFKEFEKEYKVKINEAGDQKSSFKNIINTLSYCEREGLLETGSKGYKIREGVETPIWCVFDRDIEVDDPANVDHNRNVEFNLSIQAAESAGLNVAWSNDVFELWILLHFENVFPGVWRHRNYVYNRLTEIFKALPDKSPELDALTSVPTFNYKTFFKTTRNFNAFVLPVLAARREDAIRRAKELEAVFDHTKRHHECNPCTKVHNLVLQITATERIG